MSILDILGGGLLSKGGGMGALTGLLTPQLMQNGGMGALAGLLGGQMGGGDQGLPGQQAPQTQDPIELLRQRLAMAHASPSGLNTMNYGGPHT